MTHAVKNHSISEALLAAMFDRSRAFFSLPMEDKMRIHINKYNRGYTRVRVRSACHADPLLRHAERVCLYAAR